MLKNHNFPLFVIIRLFTCLSIFDNYTPLSVDKKSKFIVKFRRYRVKRRKHQVKPGAEYGGGRVSGVFLVWSEVYVWPGFCRLEGRINYWGSVTGCVFLAYQVRYGGIVMCQECGCSPCGVCGAVIEDGVCTGCDMPSEECVCDILEE